MLQSSKPDSSLATMVEYLQRKRAASEPTTEPATETKPDPAPKAVDIAEVGGKTPATTISKWVSPELRELLNRQLGREIGSRNIYFAAANWFTDKGLFNTAGLMRKYAAEELAHFEKVNDYLLAADIMPVLPTIPPPDMPDAVLSILRAILDHEMSITQDWKAIFKLSLKDADPTAMQLASWFCTEQLEEEGKIQGLLFQAINSQGNWTVFDTNVK